MIALGGQLASNQAAIAENEARVAAMISYISQWLQSFSDEVRVGLEAALQRGQMVQQKAQ